MFEDAPKGVEVAKNVRMKRVGLTTAQGKEDFKEHDTVLFFVKDYLGEKVLGLLK